MAGPTTMSDTGGHRMAVDRSRSTAPPVLMVVANPTVSTNNQRVHLGTAGRMPPDRFDEVRREWIACHQGWSIQPARLSRLTTTATTTAERSRGSRGTEQLGQPRGGAGGRVCVVEREQRGGLRVGLSVVGQRFGELVEVTRGKPQRPAAVLRARWRTW